MATKQITDLTLQAAPDGADFLEIQEAAGGASKKVTLASIAGGGSGGTVAATSGGTGITTYTYGDTLYGSAPNTLAKLAIGTAGQVLTVVNSGGHLIPQWQAQTVSASSLGIYGDGSDGSAVLDGVNTFTWCSLAGSTYTMTRDVYLNNLTVNATKILVGKYRIFGLGTLTNNGTIHNDGSPANTFVGGGGATQGFYSTSAGGGGGSASAGGTTAGTAGSNTGNTSTIITLGGAGGAGGGANGGAGGSALSVTALLGVGSARNLLDAIQGFSRVSTNAATSGPSLLSFNGGSGGGGGGRTAASGSNEAPGGGGGGGQMLVCFRTIVNTGGTIRCNGGAGANATGAGTCVTGGGGGGGGGVLWMIYDTLAAGTEQCSGGAIGTGQNAASAAIAGGAGTVIKIQNT